MNTSLALRHSSKCCSVYFFDTQVIYHKIHPFRAYKSVVLVYSEGCSTITAIYFQSIVITLKRNVILINSSLDVQNIYSIKIRYNSLS